MNSGLKETGIERVMILFWDLLMSSGSLSLQILSSGE